MTWDLFRTIFSTILAILLAHHVFFTLVGLFKKKKYAEAKKNHSYGILIAGRNEELVIGQLLDSINKQNYDMSLVKVFVCADNCSSEDRTAEIARKHGAIVYERHNQLQIGKGYALQHLFENMAKDYPDYHPEAFMIFDADNLLDKNYIKEMNKAFDSGEKIITSYRASKNFGSSFWSMGASTHFLRECRFLHAPRAFLGLSTHVSGTGFLFDSTILNPQTGWPYTLITEDLQFSLDHVAKGYKIAYCDDAIFYDEQPTKASVIYRQRTRWAKGALQVHRASGWKSYGQFLKTGNFQFYDMAVSISPISFVSSIWFFVNIVASSVTLIFNLMTGMKKLLAFLLCLKEVLFLLVGIYIGAFLYGSLGILREWKRIKEKTWKKLLALFVYPFFIIAIIPIPIIAYISKVEWLPIARSSAKTIADIEESDKSRALDK